MYKKYGKYKRYRRRYGYYYNYNQPNILESILEISFTIIIQLSLLIGRLILKLFKFITLNLRKQPKTFDVQINKTHYNPEIETQSQIRPQTQGNIDQKYSLKPSLLSAAESEFLNILKQIVGDRYNIQCQVQMSRILNVEDPSYRYFNKIKAKSIDFILYDKEYKPCLAIELDDRTHSRWDRIKRDLFVDDVMKNVGFPIMHVRVAYPHPYDIEKLKERIFSFLI